jgi:hypothetical protein
MCARARIRESLTRDNGRDFPLRKYPARDDTNGANVQCPQFCILDPGLMHMHPVTQKEVETRILQLPTSVQKTLASRLDHIVMPTFRPKMEWQPQFGRQWESSIYLFPMDCSCVELYAKHVHARDRSVYAKFGARWCWNEKQEQWECHWTPAALRVFYLEYLLLHEIGHLLGDPESQCSREGERIADYFALSYGKPPARKNEARPRHRDRRYRRHHR